MIDAARRGVDRRFGFAVDFAAAAASEAASVITRPATPSQRRNRIVVTLLGFAVLTPIAATGLCMA
ncbi:MAG TPA: hypothetical protein VK527_01060 [Candidatus Limnocylindrales bacterium]|nr:hypothetical protein [Candidatus Limnocylindrales bacterium]